MPEMIIPSRVDAPAANAEYVSDSTIDNPPAEQDTIFEQSENEKREKAEYLEGERKFAVSLSLTLKALDGEAVKVVLLSGEYRGTTIMDRLLMALQDRRNVGIIQAVLDNPSERKNEQAELDLTPANTEVF